MFTDNGHVPSAVIPETIPSPMSVCISIDEWMTDNYPIKAWTNEDDKSFYVNPLYN